MHTSLSPPHDPFKWRLKKMVPILIAKIAIEKTKSVIMNVFMIIKLRINQFFIK